MNLTFEPALDRQDWQYATAYLDGKPVASIMRRRVYDYKSAPFTVTPTDGGKPMGANTAAIVESRLRYYLRTRA